jgi:hypothetical protein
MAPENQKSPFMVVVKVTTYTENGHPFGITEWNVRADTLKALKSEVDKFKAQFDYQNEESGGKMTIAFGPELELNRETGKWNRKRRKKEGCFHGFWRACRLLYRLLPGRMRKNNKFNHNHGYSNNLHKSHSL